jgi:plasmid stabilization system protein ParE
MDNTLEVIFRKKAEKDILDIGKYIFEQGNPLNARNYIVKLIDFGYSLSLLPMKYPICKEAQLSEKNYRCAVFDKTYKFIYRIEKNNLYIYRIIHGKRLVI